MADWTLYLAFGGQWHNCVIVNLYCKDNMTLCHIVSLANSFSNFQIIHTFAPGSRFCGTPCFIMRPKTHTPRDFSARGVPFLSDVLCHPVICIFQTYQLHTVITSRMITKIDGRWKHWKGFVPVFSQYNPDCRAWERTVLVCPFNVKGNDIHKDRQI